MQTIHIHLGGTAQQAKLLLDELVADGLHDKLASAGGGRVNTSFSGVMLVAAPPERQSSLGPRRRATAGSRRTSGRKL